MALEAVVFPHHLLGYKLHGLLEQEDDELLQSFHGHWEASCASMATSEIAASAGEASSGRKKRRRSKTLKNREEMENQRMTHIAVERNRRKQMNQHLSMLRSLMPPSYISRCDQASIIGGAINFVKSLEQLLQCLEVQKHLKRKEETGKETFSNPLFSFFSFPQYSSTADIEVAMVESHASLKVLSRRRPRQLLKLVVGLQSLRLTVLHLNVTTVEPMVLYSFSLKVEDDCRLNSGDEIAAAVHGIVVKIEEDAEILLFSDI